MIAPATCKEEGSTWRGESARWPSGGTATTRVSRMVEGSGLGLGIPALPYRRGVFPKWVFPVDRMGLQDHFPWPTASSTQTILAATLALCNPFSR